MPGLWRLFMCIVMGEKIEEFKEIFLKILFPALIVATIMVSYRRMREGKQTVFNVVSSYVSALGIAYLSGDLILHYMPKNLITVSVAIIAFSSEKIVGYLLYTFNVEQWLKSFFSFMLKHKNDT